MGKQDISRADKYRYGCGRPTDSFCCGCSLDSGVSLTLVMHMFTSIFYVITAICNLLLDVHTLGYYLSFATQTFNCAYSIASLPFLASGYSGVKYHIEVHLRIYLYWMMVTFLLDCGFLGMSLFRKSCDAPTGNFLDYGSSAACGFLRIGDIALFTIWTTIMGYFVFVVWSRCEELRIGGGDGESTLDDLYNKNAYSENRDYFRHRSGLFGTGPILSAPHPIAYGSLATPTFAGSARIFGGRTHLWTHQDFQDSEYR